MTESHPDLGRQDPVWRARAAEAQARAAQEHAAYVASQQASHARVVALLSEAIPASQGRNVEPLELARYLGSLTAKERRSLRSDLQQYEMAETMSRNGEPVSAEQARAWTEAPDRRPYIRSRLRGVIVDLACGAPLSAFGGRPISRLSLRGDDPGDMAAMLAALELRVPADRAKVLDAMMRSGHVVPSSWLLAYFAVEAGLMPQPDSAVYRAGYFEALLEMRRFDDGGRDTDPGPRIDRATQDSQFGAVIAAGLADPAVLKWLPNYSYSRIGPAIAEAVKAGLIDRRAALDAAVRAMSTSLSTNQQDVGRLTWIALAPTPPEIAARASMVWSAVAHGHPRSVMTLLDSVGDSRAAADMQVMATSLAAATASGTTASAARAWSVSLSSLDETAMSTVAVAALENPHFDIVSGALDWFERTDDPLSAVEASALREAEVIVPPRLRGRVARVLKLRGGTPVSRVVPERPRVSRSVLGPDARLDPMPSADAFRRALDEVAFAIHRPASIAVLVDSLQRWDPVDCGQALKPAVIAYRFGMNEVEDHFRWSRTVRTCVHAVDAWLDGTPMPGKALPPWSRVDGGAEPRGGWRQEGEAETDVERLVFPGVESWLLGRFAEAVFKDRQRRPSLDLPTYRSGVLDFDDLVDRIARTEAEFGEVRVYEYEWWHALNRVDLVDTAAGRRRLATLSSRIAARLDAYAAGEPSSDLERDALTRRGLVVDDPRWYSTSPPPPGSPGQHWGRRLKFVAPEVCLTDSDGAKRLVRQHLRESDLNASPGDAGPDAEVEPVVHAYPHFHSGPADRAWWLVTEPFGQDRVGAAELLDTTEWWGGTIDVGRGRTQAPIGDEGRGPTVAHVLRRYLEARREWGPFEAAYIGRGLAGLRKDDSAEALVQLCDAIEAGLPGSATGSALADFHRHGGGGLSSAGARLRDILELGGDPAWVCEAAAAFVVATPEPPRDSTELLTAWATAIVMAESWSPGPRTVDALAPYSKGSSLRAQAAREIIAVHRPSDVQN